MMDGCYQISWAFLDRFGAVLADLGADFHAVLFAGAFSMPVFHTLLKKRLMIEIGD